MTGLENKWHKRVGNMSIQKRNKLLLYVINRTMGITKNSWDSRVKKTHSLTITSTSRVIPTAYQTISIYHWISLLECLISIKLTMSQIRIKIIFLPKPYPPIFPYLCSQAVSLRLSVKITLSVHLSHFIPDCQSMTWQITNFLLP